MTTGTFNPMTYLVFSHPSSLSLKPAVLPSLPVFLGVNLIVAGIPVQLTPGIPLNITSALWCISIFLSPFIYLLGWYGWKLAPSYVRQCRASDHQSFIACSLIQFWQLSITATLAIFPADSLCKCMIDNDNVWGAFYCSCLK